MSKFEYTDQMIERIKTVVGSEVTEEKIEALVAELGYPRRSVTAKLRRMHLDVPKQEAKAPAFSVEETAAFKEFLEAHEGEFTAEEVAKEFANGKFAARQISGKALSMELTGFIKPAEKKVVAKTYTAEEEATIRSMVDDKSYLEDIAAAVGKEPNSVRGKLLSMGLKAEQKTKKENTTDAYEGIQHCASVMTVKELSEKYGKTERGVKTVLARRKLTAKDYTPKSVGEKA